MDANLFPSARLFIYNNARLLERRLFEHLFENGSRQAVIEALKAYQNPDGGFGHALEPDKRVPSSQPLDIQFALEVLDRCDLLRDPQVQRDLLLPACDFLFAVAAPDGGVSCVRAGVNAYPHAPWWTVDESKAPSGDLNPTAAIVGLLLKAGIQHPWLVGAVAFCRAAVVANEDDWFHTVTCALTFLEHLPDRVWAEGQLANLEARLRKPGVIELNPNAAGYVQMPLDWAPTPRHFARRLFDEATMARHLLALQNRQLPDGGWPITWDPISPAVELEWRGIRTLDALLTLRAYAVIQE